MHTVVNPYVVYDLFCVFIDDGLECVCTYGEGFNFSFLRGLKTEL